MCGKPPPIPLSGLIRATVLIHTELSGGNGVLMAFPLLLDSAATKHNQNDGCSLNPGLEHDAVSRGRKSLGAIYGMNIACISGVTPGNEGER